MKKVGRFVLLLSVFFMLAGATTSYAYYVIRHTKITQYDYNKYYGTNMNFKDVKGVFGSSSTYVYNYSYKRVGEGWNYIRYQQTHHMYDPVGKKYL